MGERPRLWTSAFSIAFFAHLLHAFSFHSFLHLPGLLHDGGLTELSIGVVMGTMSAAAIVSRPAIGRLTDTRGRRVVLRVGSVVHVLAAGAYMLVDPASPVLYLVRVVHGVAEGMLFTVLFTIAADLVPLARRTEGIAVFGVSGVVPLSAAGLVGDAVLERGTYDDLFALATAAALLAAIASWFLPESSPPRAHDAPPRRRFLAAIVARSLLPLWFVGLMFSLSLASYFSFLKTYVEKFGVGSVGAFFTAYTAAAIALRLGVGWLPDRAGRRVVLFPSLLFVAGGLVLLSSARSDADVVTAGVLCGVGHGFAFPILSAMVVSRARDEERGSALAMFTALFDLGLFIGGPLFGLVIERSTYDAMFQLAAALVTVGAVVWLAWEKLLGLPDKS